MRHACRKQAITVAVALFLLGGGLSDLVAPVLAQDNGANAVGFVNPGVYRATVRGHIYEWIPTEDVSLDIRPDGMVRIVAPVSKRSVYGGPDQRNNGSADDA